MAELAIKIEYASKARLWALTAMRMSFPLWAIVPVLMICGFIGTVLTKWAAYDVNPYTAFLPVSNLIVLSVLIPLLSLLTIRMLEKSKLQIDKNGIEFPMEFLSARVPSRYFAWKEIKSVAVVNDVSAPQWQKKKLVFSGGQGQNWPVDLSRIEESELEQLLVSIDVFAPHALQDFSVGELKNDLKQSIREGQNKLLGVADGSTYTELWEEELSRRFRAAAFMPLEVGMIMRNGKLTIVRHLALGGLSAVYLAQLDGGKLVTVKESVVPEDVNDEIKEKAREMFAREASLLMRLNHANIVPVLDYFVEQGRSYLMLDYMSGQDLRQYVRQNGPVRDSIVIDWGYQIAEVMAYLHTQDPPILHRDLTPDNLIVRGDGQIVVIDFGAANEFLGNATGTFVGKQSYIAPEQFRGKATTQSDIYAFGGTLYYLLTGKDPEALSQCQPEKIKENISYPLGQLVKSCTSLEAAERPQSAALLLTLLGEMSKAANRGGAVHNGA